MFLCKIKTMLGAQAILRIQIHMANNVDPDEAHYELPYWDLCCLQI